MMTIPSNCVNIWFYCGFVGREACCGVICQMSAEFFEEEGSREKKSNKLDTSPIH